MSESEHVQQQVATERSPILFDDYDEPILKKGEETEMVVEEESSINNEIQLDNVTT